MRICHNCGVRNDIIDTKCISCTNELPILTYDFIKDEAKSAFISMYIGESQYKMDVRGDILYIKMDANQSIDPEKLIRGISYAHMRIFTDDGLLIIKVYRR